MASTSTRSIGIGTGVLVGLALAVGAATASAGTADQSAWQHALHVRSEGLNATYGKLGGADPAWRRALAIRSEGLNLRYGLGERTLGTSTALRRHDALGALGSTDRQQALELVGLRIDRAQRLTSTP